MNRKSVLMWIFLMCAHLLFLLAAGENAVKDQKNITAESGQNVTLTGRAPNKDIPIIVVEWSRTDLGTEYVLLYRDEQFDPEEQHPSFVNRVDLQDRQMKDGDVSLILKDVTTADAGTYECRVIQKRTSHRKRAHLKTDPISIITLRVDPPGHTGGHTEDGGKVDGKEEDGGKKDEREEDGGKEDEGHREDKGKDGGKEDEGHREDKGKDGGKKDEREEDGGKEDEGHREDKGKDGGKEDEGHREDKGKDGGKKDGGKEDGGKKDGREEDGGKEDEGHTEAGSVGLKVGVSVSAVLLLVAVASFVIYRKHSPQNTGSYHLVSAVSEVPAAGPTF